jgi:ubiquinone/menaquinone biosynthesis C-methylase UbiE
MEPAVGMIRRERDLPCVRGDAELLPSRDESIAGAYATCAYFFSREWDPMLGIEELHRAVMPGGPLAIVDNLDGDDFSAMSEEHYTPDPELWGGMASSSRRSTSFEFETHEEADPLLGVYFGDRGRSIGRLRFAFRVGLYSNRSRGSGR